MLKIMIMNTTINTVNAPSASFLVPSENPYQKVLAKIRERVLAGNLPTEKPKKP